MDNQLNNSNKSKNIFEFLMGFFGPIVLLWLFIWFPKIDFNSTTKAIIIVFGLSFVIIFGIYIYKNTYIADPWDIWLELKNTYFSKGLVVLSAVVMVSVLLFVLYCFIVPPPGWLWNSK